MKTPTPTVIVKNLAPSRKPFFTPTMKVVFILMVCVAKSFSNGKQSFSEGATEEKLNCKRLKYYVHTITYLKLFHHGNICLRSHV